MLLGKHFCRCHDAGLVPVSDGYQRSQYGHHRLSATHVSLQKAVHLMAALHIVPDLGDNPFLGACKREWKGLITFIERISDLWHGYAVVFAAAYVFLFEKG